MEVGFQVILRCGHWISSLERAEIIDNELDYQFCIIPGESQWMNAPWIESYSRIWMYMGTSLWLCRLRV